MNKIFVWNNTAGSEALIKKIESSPYINNIFYTNKKILYPSKKAILLETDGIKLIKEILYRGIKYVFSDYISANRQGFIDICNKKRLYCIGSRMKDCKLESSKSYAKYLMKKYLINTAEYKTADNKNDLKKILEDIGLPCYIKADGLAAGLSAIKAETEEEYFKISNKYLDGYFGKSSQKIIVEKYIKGIEVSIPLILDGKNIKIFNIVRDYKRRNNQDKGSNTGGMGAYCPYILTKKQMQLVENLIKKLEFMLLKENHLYKGFMTINVIITDNKIYLLEINTRLGDSEGQTLFALLEDDLFEVFNFIIKGEIKSYTPKFKSGFSMSLNIVTNTYPDDFNSKKAYITKASVNKIVKNGIDVFPYSRIEQNSRNYIQIFNRFLSLCACGQDLNSLNDFLTQNAYLLISRNIYFRSDIGKY